MTSDEEWRAVVLRLRAPSFTDQTQDTTTGPYDFLFLEYCARHGRWLSPDPETCSPFSAQTSV